MEPISPVQELHLALIEAASFNDFDGKQVVRSLRKHRDLWHSALMDGETWGGQPIYGIKLRDLQQGYWNVDTLYIVATEKGVADNALLKVVKRWHADEIDWAEVKYVDAPVLRVWWD
jgi:hypothetical protein